MNFRNVLVLFHLGLVPKNPVRKIINHDKNVMNVGCEILLYVCEVKKKGFEVIHNSFPIKTEKLYVGYVLTNES